MYVLVVVLQWNISYLSADVVMTSSVWPTITQVVVSYSSAILNLSMGSVNVWSVVHTCHYSPQFWLESPVCFNEFGYLHSPMQNSIPNWKFLKMKFIIYIYLLKFFLQNQLISVNKAVEIYLNNQVLVK